MKKVYRHLPHVKVEAFHLTSKILNSRRMLSLMGCDDSGVSLYKLFTHPDSSVRLVNDIYIHQLFFFFFRFVNNQIVENATLLTKSSDNLT